MDLGLQGKKAILVGAARGIGMAVAEILAREGCDLAVTARSEDGVKDAVASLGRYGTRVIGRPVNVKKADDYKAWLEWAEKSARGILKSGIPDAPTAGFWNNVGQCCGSAGVRRCCWPVVA